MDSEVRINGIVHVNTVLEPNSVVPIGLIAVGNPAKILPANEHNKIWEVQKAQDFPGTVWGIDRSVPKGERTRRCAKSFAMHHQDKIISPKEDNKHSEASFDLFNFHCTF